MADGAMGGSSGDLREFCALVRDVWFALVNASHSAAELRVFASRAAELRRRSGGPFCSMGFDRATYAARCTAAEALRDGARSRQRLAQHYARARHLAQRIREHAVLGRRSIFGRDLPDGFTWGQSRCDSAHDFVCGIAVLHCLTNRRTRRRGVSGDAYAMLEDLERAGFDLHSMRDDVLRTGKRLRFEREHAVDFAAIRNMAPSARVADLAERLLRAAWTMPDLAFSRGDLVGVAFADAPLDKRPTEKDETVRNALRLLVDVGSLERTGERKGTRYRVSTVAPEPHVTA